MALWKPFRGSRSDLDSTPKHDGYVYFCDDGSLFFDYTDAAGVLQRKQINAKEAETLTGKTLDEIQKSINYNDLLNKPVLGDLSSKDTVSKSDLSSDVQTSLGKADSALQSYTEIDPTVPSWAKASTKPSYTKSEVGLGNVDNVKQYSASNPPPYPVTKVNNKTGEVTLSASDVGADASGTANSAVAAHNTNASAHSDIRQAISQLSSEKVNVSQLNSAVNTAKNETIAEVDNMLSTEVEIEVENQLDGMRSGIVAELIAQIGGIPVFGTIDDNKTITTTSMLADGTYVLRYKGTDGTYSELTTFIIGTGTGGGTGGVDNLNDMTLATGTVASWTPTTTGWMQNARINSSGAVAEATGTHISNFVPFTSGTIKVEGYNLTNTGAYPRIYFYSNGAYLFSMSNPASDNASYLKTATSETVEATYDSLLAYLKSNKGSSATFDSVRFGGALTGAIADVVITVDNEESTNSYEVDIASIGYTDNARWSISSGSLKQDTSAQGYTAINIVPITRPSGKTVTIELSGITFTGKSNAAIIPYVNDEFNSNGPMYLNEDHDYSADTGLKNFCHEDGSVTVVWDKCDWTGFKFNGYGSGANAKITYTIE